jgi:hypothetical protein
MLDQKTGRLSWGEGKALWPGMTHADFEASVLYKEELLDEEYKKERGGHTCFLKTQNIDGFHISVRLRFDHKDYLSDIILTQPEFYDWPDWPSDIKQEDYLLQIKDRNDHFLATQFQGQVEGGREIEFMFDWGTISSTFSFVHTPDACINIDIATWKFDPTFVPDNRPLYEIMGWSDNMDEDEDLEEEPEEKSDHTLL